MFSQILLQAYTTLVLWKDRIRCRDHSQLSFREPCCERSGRHPFGPHQEDSLQGNYSPQKMNKNIWYRNNSCCRPDPQGFPSFYRIHMDPQPYLTQIRIQLYKNIVLTLKRVEWKSSFIDWSRMYKETKTTRSACSEKLVESFMVILDPRENERSGLSRNARDPPYRLCIVTLGSNK
jgi:hypothetical protein